MESQQQSRHGMERSNGAVGGTVGQTDKSVGGHHNNRRRQRAKSRSEPWNSRRQASRSSCKAPRLDNQQLMELHQPSQQSQHSQRHHQQQQHIRHSQQLRNEFLEQWMEQLEETTRQMPYESLLQRVLQLESELMDTQEELKKANKHLSSVSTSGTTGGNCSSPTSSPLYCASPRGNYGSPIYASPRLVSPSAE